MSATPQVDGHRPESGQRSIARGISGCTAWLARTGCRARTTGEILNRAREKPGAVSRMASRIKSTCACKKPISGKPEIGAHFASFNFLNGLIGDSGQ
jgi:hypothetical protein